jgi:hypothetical protein
MDLEENRRFRQPPEDLATQFWITFHRQDSAQPERDLMLAVLTDAIWDYKRNLAARNARFREAQEWLFNGNDESLFSFEIICEILNFNPAAIRRCVQALSQGNI